MLMGQVSSWRQARLTLVEGSDECVAPCDRMGNLDIGAGNDVVKRGLDRGGVVWTKRR